MIAVTKYIALEEQNEESKNFTLIYTETEQNRGRFLNMKQGKVCCDSFVKPM